MYCLRCKEKTESKNIKTEGKFQKGICAKCGCKKCKIIKINGLGIDSVGSHYAKFARSAYEPVGSRGALEDKKLSTAETAVFIDGDEVIIAFRGTTPSKRDLISDARILIGTFLQGSRLKRSLQKVNEVMVKYPNKKVILVGHSLGGTIALTIAHMLKLKAYTYNVGSSPVDVKENLLQSLRCKFSSDEDHQSACKHAQENIKAYHSFGDPLSVSSLTGIHDTTIIKPKISNIHGIDNFINEPEPLNDPQTTQSLHEP